MTLLLGSSASYSDDPGWVTVLVEVAKACGPTLIICITILVVLIVLRLPLGRLIDRIKSASFPGGNLQTALTDSTVPEAVEREVTSPSSRLLFTATQDDVEETLQRLKRSSRP